MKVAGARASGTRLLAAVVLSACVGMIAGGLGAWGVYSHFGPVERVITETKTGNGAVSVGDIATAVLPSLVTVSTQPVTPAALAAGSASGLTQGFVVSADGLIVTSAHAVRGATRLRVATSDGKGYAATIAASDVADGIVVLRAAGAGGLTPLRFAASDPRVGDLAVAVFRPALGTVTTRSGVVDAIGMNANDGEADLGDLVGVDATAAPQADGAPLVDGTGAVTGVVTTVPSAQGVIAASGRDAAALVSSVQRGSAPTAATFGVTSVLIDPSVSAATAVPQGALIRSVDATGPAAGLLQPGDIVTAVNGTTVLSAGAFQPGDFGLLAGDRAVLTVTGAGGAPRSVTVTVSSS
ncbi:MAG TPA: S1C family serine protease [Candidatus Dormibacteraeota bacterium]